MRQENRKKHTVFIPLILWALAVLTSCGKNSQQGSSPTPTEGSVISESVTPTGENVPTLTATFGPSDVVVIPTVYPASQCVTWVVPASIIGISREGMDEINRLLYEKGFDCQIQFVKSGYNFGTLYEGWLDYCEQTVPVDILYTSVWTKNDAEEKIRFYEEQLLPLSEWLGSEEASALRNTYTDDEWKSVTLNGNIYVVPRAAYGSQVNGFRLGSYSNLYVNRQYEEYFEGFDGTYASLREIYDRIGEKDLSILIDGIGEAYTFYQLLGYDVVMALPYSASEGKAVNLNRSEELPKLIRTIYSDLLSGVLVNAAKIEEKPTRVLAAINTPMESEDYIPISMERHPYYPFSLDASYGVSVRSSDQELAIKILSVCFSDPDILSVWYPGVTPEEFASRIDYLPKEKPLLPSGIRFEQTEAARKQYEDQYEDYSMQFTILIYNSMYITVRPDPTDPEKYETYLNPEWDFQKAWKEYTDSVDYLDMICDAVNRDIQKWAEQSAR